MKLNAMCQPAGFVVFDQSEETYFSQGPVLDTFEKDLMDATLLSTAKAAKDVVESYKPYPKRRNLAVYPCSTRNTEDGECDRYLSFEIAGLIGMEDAVREFFSPRYKRCASDMLYLYGLAVQCLAKVGRPKERTRLAADLAAIDGIVVELFDRSGRTFDDAFKIEMATLLLEVFLLTGKVDRESALGALDNYPEHYYESCRRKAIETAIKTR